MGDEPRLVPMTITDDEARLAVQVVELQAENARLRAQIRLALDQLGVPARDVPLRQPDGIPLLPADRDLVTDQRDDSRFPFVVLYDQLEHVGAADRLARDPQRASVTVPALSAKNFIFPGVSSQERFSG